MLQHHHAYSYAITYEWTPEERCFHSADILHSPEQKYIIYSHDITISPQAFECFFPAVRRSPVVEGWPFWLSIFVVLLGCFFFSSPPFPHPHSLVQHTPSQIIELINYEKVEDGKMKKWVLLACWTCSRVPDRFVRHRFQEWREVGLRGMYAYALPCWY